MLVTEILEDLGHQTLSAEDGPSGMALLDENLQIHLVITDVGLPGGMNGRQVADAARVARPKLKVLFITGYAKSALSDGNLERGMDVMKKPFTLEAVALKVAGLLGQANGLSVS